MSNKNQKLTQEQVNEIINLYKEYKSSRKVAEKLGITKTTVLKYLKENNISCKTTNKTEQDILNIQKLYNELGSIDAVSKETGFKWETVAKYIKNDRKPRRKYHYNDSIFETIDSEEKAYWLGFIYADGYIVDSKGYFNRFSMYLQPADINHIKKFIKFIDGDEELLKINKYGYVGIDINNKKFATDLVNLGVVPRKSLILKFPSENIVPEYLLKHFIRGYFDGDGSIYSKGKNKDCVCSFCGTPNFLTGINSYINLKTKLSFNKMYYHSEYNCEIKKQGKQAISILDFIYQDCNIYLDRKYKKYALYTSNSI